MNRAGETSASIQTLGDDQTVGSPSEVVPPSGDVAANIPETLEVEGDWRTETYSTDLDVMSKDPSTPDLDVMSKAPSTAVDMSPATSTPPAAQATPPSAQLPPTSSDVPPAGALASVEDEEAPAGTLIPPEFEESIPLEPESQNSQDGMMKELESQLLASDDTGVVPLKKLQLLEAMEAEEQLPTRSLKKKRRKKRANADLDASIPTKKRRSMKGAVTTKTVVTTKKSILSKKRDKMITIEKTKPAGPPTDEGNFVKGTIMEIKEEGRCTKCGFMVERSKAKLTGKGKCYWVCKVCHTRATQLSALHGGWPPKHFRQKSEEEKQEFFRSIKNVRDKMALYNFSTNFFRTTVADTKGTQDKREYLPLSVWKKRGFNIKKIKKNNNDVQHHPVLGKLYALEITQKYNGHEEKEVQGEDHIATDKKEPKPAAHPKASARRSPEERAALNETIRAEKARATQEARFCKENMAFCQKILHRCTKVAFQLGKGLDPKFVKNLPEDIKNALSEKVATLAKTQKALMTTMRSGGKIGIDRTKTEEAIADSQALCTRLICASQMT